MLMSEEFTEDDFLFAVCGKRRRELENHIITKVIRPIEELRLKSKSIEGILLYLTGDAANYNFIIPLTEQSDERLYSLFRRFVESEKTYFPRNLCRQRGEHYDPVFQYIEKAYEKNDNQNFKLGIQELMRRMLTAS
jgi:hypothetical protein